MYRIRTILLFVIVFILFIFLNDVSAQWEKYFETEWNIQSIVFKDSTIFIGTYNGVMSSRDFGQTWFGNSSIIKSTNLIYLHGDSLFASAAKQLYLSVDNGTNWTSLIGNISVTAIAKNGNLFLLGSIDGLYLSSDNGNNWEHTQATMLSYAIINSIYMDDNEAFAGTQDWGLHRSTDNGKNWTLTTSSYFRNTIYSIQKIDSNLFVSTYGGVSKSTDSGNSWTSLNDGLINKAIYYLNKKNKLLFAVSGSEVFLLGMNQLTWQNISLGLPFNSGISDLIIDDNYIYTIKSNAIWRRKLSDVVTRIEEINKNIPITFDLNQNYPNPFNPTTTITYEIPKSSFVTIDVHDILGRNVMTLVQEKKAIGKYSIKFNAAKLSSGIYFYSLRTFDIVLTKKMILMK